MARVTSIATDVPPCILGLEQAERIIRRHLQRLDIPPDLYLRILRNTQIERRHSVLSEEELGVSHTLKELNQRYIETCLELGERVSRKAIERAGLTPQDIDSIIFVSCTGWMLPSLDGHLINRLQMSPNTRRTPINAIGCAAGAVGLSRAWEQLVVYPGSNVLLLSIELPSLTFQPNDDRMAQIVSTMIFADGAAAVVLSGRGTVPSPRILGSRTYTMKDTLGDMGYDLDEEGLHIVLSDRIPYLIRESLSAEVEALVSKHGLTRADLKWFAMHPAGPKVLYLVEQEMGIDEDDLAASWRVLRDYGNMSSAAVLFVLAEMLEHPPASPGDYGLIVAFGPGVSGELVLARWEA